MPYIKQIEREILEETTPQTPGELNYIVTNICQEYFKNNGTNYQAINDIVGALESCKLEFYRRLVSPYEDKKIKENGDVYNSTVS